MQDLLFRHVAKAHVIKANVSLDLPQHDGILPVGALGFLVHQSEDALGGGKGGLQLAHDIGKLVDGARKLAGVLHKGGYVTERQHEDGQQRYVGGEPL